MKASTIIRAAALAAACIFSTVTAWAQGSPVNPAAKLGVINLRQAIGLTAEGKQASAELQSQFAPRQTELENLNKQINDLRQRLQTGQATLNEEEKARLTAQGQKLTTQLDRKQNEYQEDLNGATSDVFERIGRKMLDVLERYSRENGYTAVFDTSTQNSPFLYVSNTIDVTQDIIRLYDQSYPVKGGTTTPAAAKPATPKPAAQQPPAQKPPAQQPQQQKP